MNPEVDPVNALPRIDIPVLMFSGEFASVVPIESAKRYFDLLGTPDVDKRHELAPGGHCVPRDLLIRETLDWRDARLAVPQS
jgi:pimeloyl-ACP methyl ester carboxylesterase